MVFRKDFGLRVGAIAICHLKFFERTRHYLEAGLSLGKDHVNLLVANVNSLDWSIGLSLTLFWAALCTLFLARMYAKDEQKKQKGWEGHLDPAHIVFIGRFMWAHTLSICCIVFGSLGMVMVVFALR